MAKKATAKKSVKMPAKKLAKKTVKKTGKKAAKKPVNKSAEKKADLRQKTIKEARIWEDLMNDSGLDIEGSGLLAAEFAASPASTLASIWEELESARNDLAAIILTHSDGITPSELRKQLSK